MFHWMLVAPQALKSVLPVEDSFSNKEMRTFSRTVSTHISLNLISANKVVHLARCATQDLYNTDTSDMDNT